jgi:hypothetical protein
MVLQLSQQKHGLTAWNFFVIEKSLVLEVSISSNSFSVEKSERAVERKSPMQKYAKMTIPENRIEIVFDPKVFGC